MGLSLPRCGLVALWMAGTLLAPPSGVPLERLVQMAMERGYTAQGEMFSGELGAEGSQASPVRGPYSNAQALLPVPVEY